MAKILDPSQLNRKINKYGPYIYFYNTDIPNYDKSMVDYMNKMASKYPSLQVFQIDWTQYWDFCVGKPIDAMNKVYLYCKNRKIEERIMEDEKVINEIFKKAIHLHNINVENKAKNIGSKAMNISLLRNGQTYTGQLQRRRYINNWHKMKLLETKINYDNDIGKSENINSEQLSKKNSILEKPETLIEENKQNYKIFVKEAPCQIKRDYIIKPLTYNKESKDYSTYFLKNNDNKEMKNSIRNKLSDSQMSLLRSKIIKSDLTHSLNLRNHFSNSSDTTTINKFKSVSKFNNLSQKEATSFVSYLKDDMSEPKSLKKYFLRRVDSDI